MHCGDLQGTLNTSSCSLVYDYYFDRIMWTAPRVAADGPSEWHIDQALKKKLSIYLSGQDP